MSPSPDGLVLPPPGQGRGRARPEAVPSRMSPPRTARRRRPPLALALVLALPALPIPPATATPAPAGASAGAAPPLGRSTPAGATPAPATIGSAPGRLAAGQPPVGWPLPLPGSLPGSLLLTQATTPPGTNGAGQSAAASQAGRSQQAAALQAEAWTLFLQGSEDSRLRALERLQAARGLLQHRDDLAALAQLGELEGLILFALARYRESNQAYGEALELYGRLGRPLDQTRLRVSLAMGFLNLGAYDQARSLLRQAQMEQRRSGDQRALASALLLEAQVEARTGRSAIAIARLEQALALAVDRGDKEQQVEILEAMALVYLPLGQVPQARQVLERRRALAPSSPSPVEALLQALETRSRPEELASPEALLERIRVFRQAGDRTNTASSLEALATVEVNRGQLRQGLQHYEEALSLYLEQGMQGRAAAAQRSVGQTLAALGEYGRALETSGRALELARQAGEEPVQIQVLLDLADLQLSLGSEAAAAGHYSAALSLAERQQDRFRQAQALNGLADLQRRQQRPQQALESAQRALAIATGQALPLLEASALSTVVRAQESLGHLQAAMVSAVRLRTLGQTSGDRWISASGEAMVARVLLARAQPALALEALARALPIYRQQQQAPALAAGLQLRGRALAALGRRQEALDTYREEEELCTAMGDPRCQTEALYQQSRLSALLDRPQEALDQIRRSLAITESLRSSLPSADLRQSYFAQVQDHYDWCIELLLQRHRQAPQARYDLEALAVSERARARGLVELLSAARAEVNSGADPALLAQRRELDGQIRAVLAGRLRLQRLSGPDRERATRLAALETRLAALMRRQQELEERLQRQSPRYAALLLPRILEPRQIQAQLDGNTLMLAMHLGPSQGVLWLIRPDGIDSHPLPARAEIQRLVAALHAALQRGGEPEAAAAQTLSRLLLQPVASSLPGRRLVIVPHGVLAFLPFAALPSPGEGQPLVVSHELITLPSASTLAALRSLPAPLRSGPPSLLVVADPVFQRTDPRLSGGPAEPRLPGGDTGVAAPAAGPAPGQRRAAAAGGEEGREADWRRLPGTAREAETISALVAAGALQGRREGFAAQRQALLAMDLRPYRLLHIATHGKADGVQPERSRLVLSLLDAEGRSIEGNLSLQDIYNLRLDADLVVLSACQSGLGSLVRGEGLVGLTRGFLHAGSRRVAASLWNVDDGSTAALMAAFYRALLVEGKTAAAALRQAQLTLRADPRWRAPYHWAAFTLHGDWR